MTTEYATDAIGPTIHAFLTQLACDTCGYVPDVSELKNMFVPAIDGVWLLSAFHCPVCRRLVTQKVFLTF